MMSSMGFGSFFGGPWKHGICQLDMGKKGCELP